MSSARLLLSLALTAVLATAATAATAGDAELSEHALDLRELPQRPKPLLELGNRFLGRGPIDRGFTLPTGATWQPSLLAWGRLRTALQARWRGSTARTEWASGLDLHAQVSLTPTERLVLGFRPWRERARVQPQVGADGGRSGLQRSVELDPVSLYFEGDLGELFPRLDARSPHPLDYGLVLGRAPFRLQDGALLDATMTGVGLSKTSLAFGPVSNLRVSLLRAGADMAVDKGPSDRRRLTAVSAEADWLESTVGLDLVHAARDRGSDGLHFGASLSRRLAGRWNASFRLLGSHRLQPRAGGVGNGWLTTAAFSVAPRGTHHLAYLNMAASFGEFTSAARDASLAGPLGGVGILFEAPGLGSQSSPLSGDADRTVAAAVGLQVRSSKHRRQAIVELAGRRDHGRDGEDELALGTRLQQALGQRFVLRLDAHGVACSGAPPSYGLRSELVVKF